MSTQLVIELSDADKQDIAERVAALVAAPSPWLNSQQAAEYLACSTQRIHDLVSLGVVRSSRDGRRLLFRREWLDAALSNPNH